MKRTPLSMLMQTVNLIDLYCSFVDRYIPGYVFFGDGVIDGFVDATGERRLPPWIGHGVQIEIDERREVVRVSQM